MRQSSIENLKRALDALQLAYPLLERQGEHLLLAEQLIKRVLADEKPALAKKPKAAPPGVPAVPTVRIGVGGCVYCGATSDLTRDHVVPKSAGGRLTVPACRRCNTAKGAEDVAHWYPRQPAFSETRWALVAMLRDEELRRLGRLV
jgi:hypothetical protein